MARRILEANLSHISPRQIAELHRNVTLHGGIGIMPYSTGFLFQAARARAVNFRPHRVLWDANQIWERAVNDRCTHLWLHENGPVHEAPTFDRGDVLHAFYEPPFNTLMDDSNDALEGFEILREDRSFRATPMDFERRVEWDTRMLKRFPKTNYFSVGFTNLLEGVHTLACGAEWAKVIGDNVWTRCDSAFAAIGDCLLEVFETIADIDDHPISVEEDVCAVRSRVLRCLRMTSEWKTEAARSFGMLAA